MRYSDLARRIGGEESGAWKTHFQGHAAKARGEDVIMLSVGDPDFSTAQWITEAAVNALRGGDTHYIPVSGRESFRAAVVAHMNRRAGTQYTATNVVATAGCQNALYNTSAVLLEPGDEAVVFDPLYVTYEASIGATGAKLVRAPCPSANGFRPDLQLLSAVVNNRTKAIFLVTPVNPTGVVFNRQELEIIAELAQLKDLWVVSDEVYGDLVFEGEHVSIASLPGMAERTVTISSLSKSHAMTGWRAGWAIGPVEFAAHMGNLNLCMTYGLPGFVQQAATEALEKGDAFSAQLRDAFRARRDIVFDALSDVDGITCLNPQAGMFVMLDIRQTGFSSAEFVTELYRQQGVTSIDGGAFGQCAKGHIRLAYTVGEAQLLDGCKRIASFVADIRKQT